MSATRLLLCAGCVAAASWLAMAADPPAGGAGGQPDDERDAYDLVLLAPAHPVFIRLDVQVDGAGLKGVRFSYAERLLKEYDQDGDGALNVEEAKRIAPLVKSSNASETFSISESWVSVDRDPADDRVTPAELADWIDRILGYPFSLTALPKSAIQSVDLFSLLDVDHDGRLSPEEQASAVRTLHKLDLDEDETFTIDEIQPLRNPQLPMAAAPASEASADQPFLLLSDDDSRRAAAARLIERYAGEARGASGRALGVPVAALGLDMADVESHDADADGRLSPEELFSLLRAPRPHVELSAQLIQYRRGRTRLSVAQDRLGAQSRTEKEFANELTLATNGLSIAWTAGKAQAVTRDNRSFYATQFRQADGDKNRYLTEQEFPATRLPNATFAQVDRNGDGMVTLEELLAVVDQEAASSRSRVVMSVTHDEKSVFQLLDANPDRRLTYREVRDAPQRLRTFDLDGDGSVSAVEMVGKFKVTLELGKPLLFQQTGGMRGDPNNVGPIVGRPASGPEWFQKMDRNRDGEVSRREFLGPREAFRRLDADGDGVITLAEAEPADTEPADTEPADTSAADAAP